MLWSLEPYTLNPEQDRILARDHGEYVRAERDVLTSVRHPFIVQLHWSFQVGTTLRHPCRGRRSVALEALNMSRPESPQAALAGVQVAASSAWTVHNFCMLEWGQVPALYTSVPVLTRMHRQECLLCVQTAAKLYLVLDFVNGGHLFFNLYRCVRMVSL